MCMLPRHECKRCGHKWIPRTDSLPTICPRCKSPYWNKERLNNCGGCEDGNNNKTKTGRV